MSDRPVDVRRSCPGRPFVAWRGPPTRTCGGGVDSCADSALPAVVAAGLSLAMRGARSVLTDRRRDGCWPAAEGHGACGEEFRDRGANFASPGSIGVVGAGNGDGPQREITRGLIARIAGGVQGAKLCSQVVAWNPGATPEQVAE